MMHETRIECNEFHCTHVVLDQRSFSGELVDFSNSFVTHLNAMPNTLLFIQILSYYSTDALTLLYAFNL